MQQIELKLSELLAILSLEIIKLEFAHDYSKRYWKLIHLRDALEGLYKK